MYTGGNLTIMVSDFERAIGFYTDTLGLKLRARYGSDWAEVELPGLTIGLHPAGAHGPASVKTEGLSVGIAVDSLEEVMTALQARGVAFAPPGIIDGGVERLAYFHDPDQTPLYLFEMKQS
jgi:catechol 2,3-dioxygenase-like lactoylglutathione lyase family enzyme